MPMQNVSSSMQDYLEVILNLIENEETARVTDIANKLKIAKASVNQTVNRLKRLGLVQQQAYGPVELTLKGREIAEIVRKRHRKLREFLVDVLGVEKTIAETDACLMEHVISVETMEKLTAFLKHCHNCYRTDGKN